MSERYVVERAIDKRIVYGVIGVSVVSCVVLITVFFMNVRTHKLDQLDHAVSLNDYENAVFIFDSIYQERPLDVKVLKSGVKLHYANMRAATNEAARVYSSEKVVSLMRRVMLIDWWTRHDAATYAVLARAYYVRGESFYNEAIADADEAIRRGDTRVDLRLLAGTLCFARKRYKEAIAHWEHALLREKANTSETAIDDSTRYLLGEAYAGAGDYGKAIPYLSALIGTIDESFRNRIHASLGELYLRQGLYTESEYHLKEALKADDKNPKIYYTVGVLYKKMNRIDLARRYFQRAWWLDKKFTAAAEALEKL